MGRYSVMGLSAMTRPAACPRARAAHRRPRQTDDAPEFVSAGPLSEVEIYTDGGCEPNPGPGGYGVVLLHPKKRAEASGGFRLTTNNRMEIFAAIQGLIAKLDERDAALRADVQAKDAEIAALKQEMARLRQAVDALLARTPTETRDAQSR